MSREREPRVVFGFHAVLARLRIGTQTGKHRMEAEHHARLAFAAHFPGSAGTRSILR